jgi:chromate transporter
VAARPEGRGGCRRRPGGLGARNLASDRERASLAILAAFAVLVSRSATAQVLVIIAADVIGWIFLPASGTSPTTALRVPIGKGLAIGSLAVFFGLLVGLPIARQVVPRHVLAVFDSFYRAGSLVFGGGTWCCRCSRRRSFHRAG